tara:strand:+ start:50 stop:1315 length:1266 start_codon:yes stop_codon:yes gene_type:complete
MPTIKIKVMTELKEFIEEMRATSSATEKIAIIKRSSTFIHNILEATYNPYKQYYVTSKTCIKNKHLTVDGVKNVFEILDILRNREATGHDAIKLVNGYGDDLIYKIIDKDLGIRVGDSIINKAIPNLIPTFKVALAKEYDGKCNWDDNWFASRKLDGVRCLAVVDFEGKCTLYSRTGNEFTTLNKVKLAIEETGITNTVFDGEICLLDENGDEDFQSVMKELRRKNHQIENPVFMLFDMIQRNDFDNNKSTEILSDRLAKLRTFTYTSNENVLRKLQQYVITGDEHFEKWSKLSSDNNWEGFMLRKDAGYEGKRSKNLLKVKKFFDAEYKVIDFDIDDHEVVRNGKSITLQLLAQVYIEHKGHRVKVGSGFTQEQRLQYMDGSIVGKIITVQYFEETHNDKGGISLRFPTLKHIYEGERNM